MAQHRTNMPQVNTPLLWFLFWVRNPLHIVATQLSRRPVSLYWLRRYWESAGDMFLERESTQKLAINIVLIICYGCLTLNTFGTECIQFQLLLLFVPDIYVHLFMKCGKSKPVWEAFTKYLSKRSFLSLGCAINHVMSYLHELIYARNNYYENVQFCEFDVFFFYYQIFAFALLKDLAVDQTSFE